MGQLEAGEFGLMRAVAPMTQLGEGQVFQVPVVQRPVVPEFQRAQRMCDAFDGVALAVCPVVGGIDAPAVAAAVVMLVADAVHHRVTHLHVLVLHVDTGTQHPAAFGMLTGGHLPEQAQVLGGFPIPVGALDAWLSEAPAPSRDGFRVLVVDIGQASLDQVFRPCVELFEVVRGKANLVRFEAQPPHVVDDGLDVLGTLGCGVRVVKAQKAAASELGGHREVQADRLGVTNVEIPVRFRRKAGLNPACETLRTQVRLDLVSNEVATTVGGLAHRGSPAGGPDSVRHRSSGGNGDVRRWPDARHDASLDQVAHDALKLSQQVLEIVWRQGIGRGQ